MTEVAVRRTTILSVLIVLIVGICSFFGEHIQFQSGVGLDGQVYAAMLRGFPHNLWDGTVDPYYAHRIVVPALMRGALELLGVPLSNENIWRAFALNTILLQSTSALLWMAIARNRRLTESQAWIGFAALFMNFEAVKNSQFQPVLLDSTAVFLSLTTILLFLKGRRLALSLVSIIGGLTWSTPAIVGALLLMFPAPASASKPREIDQRLRWLPLLTLGIALIVYGVMEAPDCPLAPYSSHFAQFPGKIGSHVCLTAQEFATFWPMATVTLLALIRLLWADGWLARPRNVVLAVLTFLIPEIAARLIANPALNRGGADAFLLAEMTLTPSPGLFFLPIVSVAVFWGPLVLLSILRWPEVCERARCLGAGVVAVLVFALMLMLPTEPRYITYFWAFIVLCTVEALPRVTWVFASVFMAVSVVASKIWLPLNTRPWPADVYHMTNVFPPQRYFMSLGYWMIPSTFWPQAIACAVVLLGFLFWDRSRGAESGVAKANEMPPS